MYDPTIGRWISEDPLGFEAADPNLYRYVGNKPTATTDPSGLRSPSIGIALGDALTPIALAQEPANPFTSGANDRGRVAAGNRANALAGITRLNPANLPTMPDGWTFSRVIGGFKRGVIPANTLLGPSGCGPCVGVIIYSVDDPMLPTYAFHFAFDPAESPAATFRRQIAHTTAGNWVQIRGGYRAVLCGAQVGNDAQQNAESAALLQAAVNAVRNEVRVTITGYVAGTGVAVDRAGTIYWPYGPGTPVNAPGY